MLDWNEIPKWDYYKEWLAGKHQTPYNECKFAKDKVSYCRNLMEKLCPSLQIDNPENVVDYVAKNKLRIASDDAYCKLCSNWADKITAKAMIFNEGMEDIIIPTLYMTRSWLRSDEVEKYVKTNTIVKMNHGSGWNIMVKNKCDPEYIEKKTKEWYDLNYAYITGYERQYEDIVKGTLVEPILVDKPIDYGFWCINGEIEGISLTKKLGKNLEEYLAMVDVEGKKNSWRIGCIPAMDNLPPKFMKYVDEMKPYVMEISKKFDFVRVDMYHINGRVYFGETTFTPCSGILECYDDTDGGKRIR